MRILEDSRELRPIIRRPVFTLVAEALGTAILSGTARGNAVARMRNSLVSEKVREAEILNGTDLVEFNQSGLNQLLEPVPYLLGIDIGVAGKDFVLELLGGIASATHIVDEGEQADE